MYVAPSHNKLRLEKQTLPALEHRAFFRHCMKIDGFDIISKTSLSHMPVVERTG